LLPCCACLGFAGFDDITAQGRPAIGRDVVVEYGR
jgi:hypothetical protein